MKRLFKNKARSFYLLMLPDTNMVYSQEDGDPFLKTVKVSDLTNGSFESFRILKMKLDTGCEAHDLVSSQAIRKLGLMAMIKFDRRPICVCLNGQELISVGTVELQWKGKSFRSIFSTQFEVIEGEVLPWDIVLGAKTIEKHGILKFCGFGGRRIHPVQSEGEFSCPTNQFIFLIQW